MGLFVGSIIGYSLVTANVASYETRINSLKTQVNELRSQVNDLNDTISSLKTTRAQPLRYEVYFSPNGGAADRVIYWIDRANSSINVLIYSFTLDAIGDAIVRAKTRGVQVKVVFEKEQINTYSEYQKLKSAGVQVANDTNPDLLHDKIAVIDGGVVLTGSFNWSRSADEKNNDNLLVIFNQDLAGKYLAEFNKIWDQSRK